MDTKRPSANTERDEMHPITFNYKGFEARCIQLPSERKSAKTFSLSPLPGMRVETRDQFRLSMPSSEGANAIFSKDDIDIENLNPTDHLAQLLSRDIDKSFHDQGHHNYRYDDCNRKNGNSAVTLAAAVRSSNVDSRISEVLSLWTPSQIQQAPSAWPWRSLHPNILPLSITSLDLDGQISIIQERVEGFPIGLQSRGIDSNGSGEGNDGSNGSDTRSSADVGRRSSNVGGNHSGNNCCYPHSYEYSLEAWMRNDRGVLETEESVLFVVYQLIHALGFAHKRNVTHRDLHPKHIKMSNMLWIEIKGFQLTDKSIKNKPNFRSPMDMPFYKWVQ
ncbi:hypothetical protein AAMO2058_000952400, partial [Amorphochlora amoebiformis]